MIMGLRLCLRTSVKTHSGSELGEDSQGGPHRTCYRSQVAELHDALQEESEAKRLKAGEILRSLVKEIILTPEDDELQIDVRGDLAGILTVAVKAKTPATKAGGTQVEMVAGTGSNLNLPKQKGRPVGAADLRDLTSQFGLVAGVRNQLRRNSV
jgi:hypothetical protein